MPFIGFILYWILGVNRIRRKTERWQKRGRFIAEDKTFQADKELEAAPLPEYALSLLELKNLTDRIIPIPLVYGNSITTMVNGDEAYPVMISAIEDAKHSVHLSTYIFDTDNAGRDFVKALADAAERGVEVRVIVDAMGELYSRPKVSKLLKKTKVEVERFLTLRHGAYINLRNHRKMLIVDGKTAFTGGMNIGDRHVINRTGGIAPVKDLHFKIKGPVIPEMQKLFLDDWFFITGKHIDNPALFPSPETSGNALARVIGDGPDKEFRILHAMILGALSCAQKSVYLVTPYFIPDKALIAALITAALKGVKVTILLPALNNLPFVHWATRAYLWEFLENGIHIYYEPPPFAHTKLFIVDGIWSLIGSANIDPRSLRLNFEINTEIYDQDFCAALEKRVIDTISESKEVTLEEVDARSILVRLKDGIMKLFSPYL